VHKPWFVPEKYTEPYKHITDETRRTYCGVVACLDESIGNITNTLQELHLWEDSIVIFTSGISILIVLSHTLLVIQMMLDNGGVVPIQSNFPLRGGKNSLFEGGLRVQPLPAPVLVLVVSRYFIFVFCSYWMCLNFSPLLPLSCA